MTSKKRILLLSGYDAASHAYWRKLLAEQLSEFEWTQIALPPRDFAWRVRGSSLSIATEHAELLALDYDLIIATSMVDLASLRGFKAKLCNIPTLLYFHENQFVYPLDRAQPNILNAQLTSLYAAFCADKVVFNSQFNLNSFWEGVNQLFKKLPQKPPRGWLQQLKAKMLVLPVPLNEQVSAQLSTKAQQSDYRIGSAERPLKVVWNHRWEYDKQPEVFFAAMNLLINAGVSLRLSVLGQAFRQIPECFYQAESELKSVIAHWGYQKSRQDYINILQQSDLCISSALHDFQGLSVQEAILTGCSPVAPNRVAYPEYLAEQYLYQADNNPDIEAENLALHILNRLDKQAFTRPSLGFYRTSRLIPQYREQILNLIE
ncbi:tRNA-queuosine alpha-mannosyltransferase domain-containing protein [Aliikangiella sp. IMCC44653]